MAQAPTRSKASSRARKSSGRGYRTIGARNSPVNIGRNNFDRRTLHLYPRRQCRMAGFHQGRLRRHQRRKPVARDWMTQVQVPGASRRATSSRRSFADTTGAPISGFVMNTRRPQFQDRKVRQALTLAYDFETLNRTIIVRAEQAHRTAISRRQELASSGLPQGKELEILTPSSDKLPPEVFTQEFKLPVYDTPQESAPICAKRSGFSARPAGHQRWQDDQRQDRPAVPTSKSSAMTTAIETTFNAFMQTLRKIGIDGSLRHRRYVAIRQHGSTISIST